mgnify:CR=1 FL=1
MRTPVHLVVSLILSALLYPLFGWKALLILISGVTIDIDHYFWYISKFKEFNLFRCYECLTVEAEKNNWKDVIGSLFIFHTIEFLLIIVVASFYSEYALIFLIGLSVHYLLDFIWHCYLPKRMITNPSIISWILKNKQKA